MGNGGTDIKTIVCVLGAPRSGTSLTTRLLNICGLYLGEKSELIPPSPENRDGFWELRRAVRLNERILRAVGGSSVAAPALAPGWEGSAQLEALREEARALIDETFAGQRAWGWKDPRNSFTLPFWEALLPQAARSVICVRSPFDVAASGREMGRAGQHPMTEREALEGWGRYTASAIINTRGRTRRFVAYEQVLRDPWTAAEQLASFAQLYPPERTANGAIGAVVDRRLQHHRTPVKDAPCETRLPPTTRSLYRALQTHLQNPESSDDGGNEELDDVAQRLLAADPEKIVGPSNLHP